MKGKEVHKRKITNARNGTNATAEVRALVPDPVTRLMGIHPREMVCSCKHRHDLCLQSNPWPIDEV